MRSGFYQNNTGKSVVLKLIQWIVHCSGHLYQGRNQTEAKEVILSFDSGLVILFNLIISYYSIITFYGNPGRGAFRLLYLRGLGAALLYTSSEMLTSQ